MANLLDFMTLASVGKMNGFMNVHPWFVTHKNGFM